MTRGKGRVSLRPHHATVTPLVSVLSAFCSFGAELYRSHKCHSWMQPELFETSTCRQIPEAAAELRDREAFASVSNSSELQSLSGSLSGEENHGELFGEVLCLNSSAQVFTSWCTDARMDAHTPAAATHQVQATELTQWGNPGRNVVSTADFALDAGLWN